MAFETNVKGAVTLDFSGVTDKTGLYINEAGKYLVQVQKVLKKEGQDSEFPYFEWTLECIAPAKYKGKTIRDFTNLNPDDLWKIRNTIMAIMDKEVPKSAVSLDFSKLLGRKLGIDVAMRDNKKKPGEQFARVVGVFPASKYAAPAASVTDDDEVEDEGAPALDEDELG